jgi:nicotinic acid mononucleotide adenylyltransferase
LLVPVSATFTVTSVTLTVTLTVTSVTLTVTFTVTSVTFTVTDASLDVVTSRKVRDKIKLGHSIEQLVGEKINEYVNIHHIGAKVRR